jgi:transposase
VPRVPGPKNSTKQKPGRDLLEFCKERSDDVFRFTGSTSIWPTNNISERGVRPLKTQQKISGRLASDDVTQDRLDIRSSSTQPASTARTPWTSCTTSCSQALAAARTGILPVASRNPRYPLPRVNGLNVYPARSPYTIRIASND